MVEYGLGVVKVDVNAPTPCIVLILVVVEYGLGVLKKNEEINRLGLNPCCGGIWSRS